MEKPLRGQAQRLWLRTLLNSTRMSNRKKPPEAVSGRYTPIPHEVLDSAAFQGASFRAKALLFELLRQHNGRNNGHMQLSVQWLKTRGWASADQIQKAKVELLERKLVIKTRLGGLSIGPDRYALTWLPITDFSSLDMRPGGYHPGVWRRLDVSATVKKQDRHTVIRNNTVPPCGMASVSAVPPHGTLTPDSATPPIPPRGNDECCQLPGAKKRSRVVGKRGRSGIRKGNLNTAKPTGTEP